MSIGFMQNSRIPILFNSSFETLFESPLQRITGISGLIFNSSSAKADPVISGIVWSVITRSKFSGFGHDHVLVDFRHFTLEKVIPLLGKVEVSIQF